MTMEIHDDGEYGRLVKEYNKLMDQYKRSEKLPQENRHMFIEACMLAKLDAIGKALDRYEERMGYHADPRASMMFPSNGGDTCP